MIRVRLLRRGWWGENTNLSNLSNINDSCDSSSPFDVVGKKMLPVNKY